MDLNIKNKRAIVTGAGRGLGRAIAIALANEGVKIIALSRTKSDIDSLIDEIGGENNGHLGVYMDIIDPNSANKLFKIASRGGPIDIVVHNAGGTLDIIDPFCSIDEWRNVFRFNFEFAVEFNNLVIPLMRKLMWGRICHISSISAMESQGTVPYGTYKAAITAYTRGMGGVVAKDGIVITAVLPGAIFTEKGYWDLASKERPGHVKKYLEERQRIGRFGRPDEIGNFVAYLCSDLASFNTGSIIPVDGGLGRGYFGQ